MDELCKFIAELDQIYEAPAVGGEEYINEWLTDYILILRAIATEFYEAQEKAAHPTWEWKQPELPLPETRLKYGMEQ